MSISHLEIRKAREEYREWRKTATKEELDASFKQTHPFETWDDIPLREQAAAAADPYYRCIKAFGKPRFESFDGEIVEVEYTRWSMGHEMVYLKDHRARFESLVENSRDLDLHPDILILGEISRYERIKNHNEYTENDFSIDLIDVTPGDPKEWCGKDIPITALGWT
jgi:hypothetical protein